MPSNANYEVPNLDESVVDGIAINPEGALSGQALVYDNFTNSFIPGSASGNLNGSLIAGQIAYGVGTESLTTASGTGASNFVWNDTDGYLGIGTASPSYQLHVLGDGYLTNRLIINSSSALVSPSGTGAFRFNSGHIEFSESGGAWTQLGSGAVSSVSNSNGSLTISPTTGAVVASLNLGHANTWSAQQTFSGHIIVDGYTIDLSGGAVSGQALVYNGTSFVPTNQSGGLSGLTNTKVPYATGSSTIADSGMVWDNTNKILTVTTLTGNDGVSLTDGTRTVALGTTSSTGTLGTTSNHNLVFYTNNSAAQMTLSTSGKLGIGATPSFALHVVGDGYITSRQVIGGSAAAVSPSGTGALRFNSGTQHLEFSENGGSWTQFGTGGGGGSIGSTGQMLIDIVPAGTRASNGSTTPLVVHSFAFNPADYTLSGVASQSYVFRAVVGTGNSTVTAHVKLRDITSGVDIVTFNISNHTTQIKFEQTLTVSSAGTNTIASSEKIYEVRIYVDSPSGLSDTCELYSAEMRVISTF